MKTDKFNFSNEINIFLADNDKEDCLLFREALDKLSLSAKFMSVQDGDQLMHLLKSFSPNKHKKNNYLPHILCLDLNMPSKSDFKCLSQKKSIKKLKAIPIVIISSSIYNASIDLLYGSGANYYIQKPSYFSVLKNIFHQAFNQICSENLKKTTRDTFVLQPYN